MSKWNGEPENTCPLIDSVIEDLIDLAKEEMEEIRQANISIREWGGKKAGVRLTNWKQK